MPVLPDHPSRRTVLRAAVLVGLATATAGCGLDLGDVRWGEPGPPPAPEPSADELARRRAVVTARQLAAAVATAQAARPDLGPVLATLAAGHDAHLQALGPLGPSPALPTPSASTSPVAAADPLEDLLARELAGASEALSDVVAVEPGLARLLASVGASRVVHATSLAAALGRPAPAPPVAGAPPSTGSPEVGGEDAAQAVTAALDGEHAAVYTFGVVAARLADSERERAVAALEAHRVLVGRLSTWLLDAGREVPPAAPAYTVPTLRTPQDAITLAGTLEEQVAVLDASLVAASTGELRAVSADLLTQRALASAAWRGRGVPFPGLPELA